MFKKIIWATDGSDCANSALALAADLAKANKSELVAVHSIEYLVAKGAAPQEVDEDDRQAAVSAQVEDLLANGVNAKARIVEGGMTGAAHTVAEVAREEGADLIIVGARGHSTLAGLLLGSVPQRLLHLAPCPVLVVPCQPK